MAAAYQHVHVELDLSIFKSAHFIVINNGILDRIVVHVYLCLVHSFPDPLLSPQPPTPNLKPPLCFCVFGVCNAFCLGLRVLQVSTRCFPK